MNESIVSLVIPCYNEQENLNILFSRLAELLIKNQNIKIVLFNNGSTDNSEILLEEFKKMDSTNRVQLVQIKKNKGYGFGIMQGLKVCDTDLLSWTHADIQTDPFDIIAAIDRWENAAEKPVMVKGKRISRKWGEAFFSWGMGLFASFVLRTRLKEINAQPKLFSREFFNQIKDDAPDDFSLDLYFLFKAKKLGKVIDIPVYISKRMAGEAKGGSGSSWKQKFKLIKRTFTYIMTLRNRL